MSRMTDYYDGAIWAGLLLAIFVGLFFAVALYIVTALFLRKIFEKAGVANPNVAWIPIYNYMLFAKLGDLNPLIALGSVVLVAIPVLNYIAWLVTVGVHIAIAYRVNQKLQKDPVAFTIFAVLLAPIWLGVIAFGQGVWNTASKPVAGIPPVPPPPWATQAWLMDTTTWGGVPFQGYAAVPPAAPAAPTTPPPAA
jgi:hypothetical protein